MKNYITTTLAILFVSILLFNNCSSDPTSPNETNPFTQAGYKMEKYFLETASPSFVNILFQVSDMNNKGVTNLSINNFELFEDEQPVSPTESQMEIVNKQNVYKLKTVLCLDNSSSVGSNLNQIKSAALTLINNIVPEQEVAVYVFSENPILLQDFTNNKNDLINAVNSITLGFATTNLYGTIIETVSRWEDTYTLDEIIQGFLVILTDGRDTQGSSTLEQALNARGNKKIYTIGLGSEIDPEILKQLGNAGSYSINDINQLSQLFGNIQEEIEIFSNSFYWLRYLSPTRGNIEHQLKLKIKNNQNTSSNSYITGSFNSWYFITKYLKLTNPKYGLIWNSGVANTISWEMYSVSQIKIELSTDDGETWSEIAVVSNVENYSWSIPAQLSTTAQIKISDNTDPNIIATTISNFLIRDPNRDFDFLTVSAGPFTRGQNNITDTLDYDYDIMKYEVTNLDYLIYLYEAYAQGKIVRSNGEFIGYYSGDEQYPAGDYELFSEEVILFDGFSFKITSPDYQSHPVVSVTWFGAKLFAEFYNLALPSDKEWEKAARGNTGWNYPWGNAIDGSRANYRNSGDPFDNGTTTIGYYNGDNGTTDSPSPYGAYDIAGNVIEWINSASNPNEKGLRGGHFNSDSYQLASYIESGFWPEQTRNFIGFRCLKK